MSTEYLTGVKYIELTQGKYAIVDDWVAPLVSQYKWHVANGYAVHSVRRGQRVTKVYMQTFIWESVNGEIPNGLLVDHKEGRTLDNRLSELRLLDRRLNRVNSEAYRNGFVTSRYSGVHWASHMSKWVSRIRISGVLYYLGCYTLEEDAAAAYWKALEDYEERGELPHKRRNL